MNKRLVSILISTALVFSNITTAMAEPAMADSVGMACF